VYGFVLRAWFGVLAAPGFVDPATAAQSAQRMSRR
jgi:hypothetical protein